MGERVVVVGPSGAEFGGGDNRAIQAAIETVAWQGGGTVKVLPGDYVLNDSIHLRDNVRLVGSGEKTLLRKAAERRSALKGYMGYGHCDISLQEPERFEAGMGVTIRDKNAFGFYETVATLLWREGDRFGIDQMMYHDYAAEAGGEVYSSFAPISARFVSNVEVRDVMVEGNRDENPHFLNSCRGAGVYLLAVKNATVAGVTVRDLNGDAIGFQQCKHVRIEDCMLENNAGNGMHPGSGSVGGTMLRCKCRGNGGEGVFFCLRATYCSCEGCEMSGNRGHGVSIGGRDGNNEIAGCTIERNGAAGVFFRESDEFMAPHATLIAGCTISDNCAEKEDAEVLVQSSVRDVHVLDNAIRHGAGTRPVCGVRVAQEVLGAAVFGNRFSGAFAEEVRIECGREVVSLSKPDRSLAVGPGCAPKGADRHLPPNVRD